MGRRHQFFASHSEVMTWNSQTGNLVSFFKPDRPKFRSVAFSPDGTRIAVGSSENVIILDAEVESTVSRPRLARRLKSVHFFPDGTRVSGGKTTWDVRTGEIVSEDSTEEFGGDRSSDDDARTLVMTSGVQFNSIPVGGTLTYGRVRSNVFFIRRILRSTKERGSDRAICILPSSNGDRFAFLSDDSTIRIWDKETDTLANGVISVRRPRVGTSGFAFSSDGLRVAVAYYDNQIRVWDMTPRTPRIEFVESTSHGLGSLSNDDLSFWTLGDDGWIRGTHNELLLWVPSNLRPTLVVPPCIGILNCEFSTTVDFLGSVHGNLWGRCFDQLQAL